ncbi:hypothetical protein RvY_12033 [Ramazzottius varieornatus]|uniref:Reverse transcriptase domain-containing protein n=1 Tax=Ramazzottius varieornatus TaxID=947166 RepID=A0A1D1VKH1_RAMVA|nr:hypothetical protein RvY_12033 [Ramazzottius varieornatus]
MKRRVELKLNGGDISGAVRVLTSEDHLKDLLVGLREPMSLQLAQALADLVGSMLDGKVPEDVCPALYGASLIALSKKTGGIRPIAVGNTEWRSAGKIISKRVMEATSKHVRPQKLGYGTRGGAEAAVHSTRGFLSGQAGRQILLKLDFRNAFNSVSRDRLLEEAQKFLPEIYPFIFQMYMSPTNLIYGEHVIPSARGVQHGDLLGPSLFCLLTRNLSKSLQSPFNVWYLDNATLGGDFELVSRDLHTIVEIGASLGLELNTSKCEFVVCGGTPTQQQVTRQKMKLLCPGVIFPDKETLTLLGAPVFTEAIPPVLEKKSQQAELMITRLEKISARQALFLLKNCLSLPKLLYILRCSPTFSCLPSLQAFDETIRKCAGKIAKIAMDDTAWRQSSLPVSRGGLGIRRVDEPALPAFLASVHSSFDLMKQIYPQVDVNSIVSPAIHLWQEQSISQPPILPLRSARKAWDIPIVDQHYQTLLDASNLLDDNSFRISVGLRLGAGLCEPHVCRCKKLVDELGRLISCKVSNALEPNGILRDDQKRPDGLALIPWQQETYLRGSAGQLGYAANKAEELKRHKYRELDGRYLFCPVAFETFGAFGNAASSLIQQIGKRIEEATGETRSLTFLKQKLSIDIQRDYQAIPEERHNADHQYHKPKGETKGGRCWQVLQPVRVD